VSKQLSDYLYYHEDGPPELNIYVGNYETIAPMLENKEGVMNFILC